MKRNAILVVAAALAITGGLAGMSIGAPVLRVGDHIIFRPLTEFYPFIHLYAEEPAELGAPDTPEIPFKSVGRRIATVKATKGTEHNCFELQIDGMEKHAYLTRTLPIDREALLSVALPIEEWQAAQKLVGITLWRSVAGDEDTDELPHTKNLAKFFVIGVDLAGDLYNEPLKFTMKALDGKKGDWYGYLADVSRLWYTKNPKSLHTNWSARVWKSIENREALIGMTPEQAVFAWGRPENINRSTGRWGVHEQWVYGMGCYLYFENGRLDALDN